MIGDILGLLIVQAGGDVEGPCYENEIKNLCKNYPPIGNSDLVNFLSKHNGAFWGDGLWEIWPVDRILETSCQNEFLPFCDTMIMSEVYWISMVNLKIYILEEDMSFCVANDFCSFVKKGLQYSDLAHLDPL